jgi:hypothetical protein
MKYLTLDIAVKEDVDVAIEQTRQFNIDRERAFITKNKLRASFIVRAMMGKRLFSYFLKWRKESNQIRDVSRTKVWDKLLKVYRNYQLIYFQRWKDQINLAVMQKRAKMVADIEANNMQWHKEALANEKNIQDNEDKVRNLKRRLIDKMFRKLFFKRLSLGMKKWKSVCNNRTSQEEMAAFVIKKLRLRLINDAFTRYLIFYKKSLQHDRNVNSATHMRQVLEHKTMRKTFNAICFYTNRQKTSHGYWIRIFTKVENFMKSRAIKKWNMNSNLRYENKLIHTQDRIISEISQRNQEIKRCEELDYSQDSHIGG